MSDLLRNNPKKIMRRAAHVSIMENAILASSMRPWRLAERAAKDDEMSSCALERAPAMWFSAGQRSDRHRQTNPPVLATATTDDIITALNRLRQADRSQSPFQARAVGW